MKDLDKLEFPGEITFEVDDEGRGEGEMFEYDIEVDDEGDEEPENLDILDPRLRSKIRSVATNKAQERKVSFANQTLWIDARGMTSIKPVSMNKYTLTRPNFTSCI